MHPDFDNIEQIRVFTIGLKNNLLIFRMLYIRMRNDAIAAARAIDLYKADMGMITEKRSDAQLEKEAAKAVAKTGKNSPSARQTQNGVKASC
jgi:hypothetical protein